MDPQEMRRQYRAIREKALAITDTALADDRQLTGEEQKQLSAYVERGKALHAQIEADTLHASPELMKQLTDFSQTPEAWSDSDGIKAPPTGVQTRELHPWTKALKEATHLVRGVKAGVTGGGQGTVVAGSLGDPAARLGTPGGEMLAQITVEPWGVRGDGSTVSFLRQTSRALAAAAVAVGAAKPASSIGLDLVTADVLTYAHNVPSIPIQWLQDAQNLDILVRSELAYGVQLAAEAAIVGGAGPLPGAPLGILHDAAVTQIAADTDAPTTILDGLTAISAAGYGTGSVCLNPTTWKQILSLKDTTKRFLYGGSPFAGPARTLWSTPVVLSNAIPATKAIVGDLRSAIRFVERQPVQVLSGTVNDDLTKNLRTFVGEARAAFVTVRPQSLAVCDLTGMFSLTAPTGKATKTA